MKTLDPKQAAFKAEEITYLDRKSILLDRMLLNFFELLRFDGRPPVRRRRKTIDVEAIVRLMQASPERFPGFDARPDVASSWLASDLLEIQNRGKPGRETVVGPRPFHINAFKLANPKAMQDYGASKQAWALLYHADPGILKQLKEFFQYGLDPALDRYDGVTKLDLETLAVLGLVDQVSTDPATSSIPPPRRPLCLAQGRLMAEDLRLLLAYEGVVPRHVLASYVRVVLGLHLGLYMLRLLRLVPNRVERALQRDLTLGCPIECGTTETSLTCPYAFDFVVDLTDEARSAPASLAAASASRYMDAVPAYVRAVIMVNRIKEFATVMAASGKIQEPNTLDDLLKVLAEPPSDIDGYFTAWIGNAISVGQDEGVDPVAQGILRMEGLSALEKYVELVCLQRMKIERGRVVDLVDSLAQKNKPGGFLRQPAGRGAARRFSLHSSLLEALVQIAVLERGSDQQIRARPVLIDEFVDWLRTRYGFVVYAPAHRAVLPEEQEAWKQNQQALRDRLHQIGFFVDLSDAYNSQTLRPRYSVQSHA